MAACNAKHVYCKCALGLDASDFQHMSRWVFQLVLLPRPADSIAKPLSMIFERLWQSGKVPGDWRKTNIAPIFKKGRNGRSLGTTNLSASPLRLGRSWSRSS